MTTATASKLPEPEFLSFNGTYQAAPETTSGDLLDDAGCWMDGAIEIVNNLALELGDRKSKSYVSTNPVAVVNMLWAAFHLLGMVKGAIELAQVRMPDLPSRP